jgi:uncharacterized membrane protein (DUF4010 family)
MDWNGDLKGWLAALGIGLLIGVVRERRSVRDLAAAPSAGTPVRAGLRTHGVLALAAAAAMQLGTGVLAVLLLAVAALVVASYWASHREDPGMTGEIALLLTTLLAALAMREPALAAGLAVIGAILLQAKDALHRFVRELVSERELNDALLLAAAALVVLPLLPDHPLDPWGALRPALLWKFVVLVMAVGMAGHVALRAVGARWGLPVAGFFAGFASSTAAVAGFGASVRDQPELRTAAVAAALLANVASLLLFAAIIGTGAPALLRAMALPLGAAVLVLVAGGTLGLRGHAATVDLPDAPPPRAFHLSHGLALALLLAAVLLGSAWMRLWFGDAGALFAAALVALGELHAAGASIAQLAAGGSLEPAYAEWGVLALLGAAALSKSVVAFASGGAGYGARVATGLFGALLAAAAVQALLRG